jgi:hypothetical protein
MIEPSTTQPEKDMQRSYITESTNAPQLYTVIDGWEVIDVSHEFPEDGFSYEAMRNGLCGACVRVTVERVE